MPCHGSAARDGQREALTTETLSEAFGTNVEVIERNGYFAPLYPLTAVVQSDRETDGQGTTSGDTSFGESPLVGEELDSGQKKISQRKLIAIEK